MEQLEFPDGCKVIEDLINGETFDGKRISAGQFTTADALSKVQDEPFVLITTDGGVPGYVDQVEQLTLQVNAAAGTAKKIASEIRTQIIGENIDTAHGFVDAIKCDRIPTVTPVTDQMDQATLLVSIISRPL